MHPSESQLFSTAEIKAAELVGQYEALIRSGADQDVVDEAHDAIIRFVASLALPEARIGTATADSTLTRPADQSLPAAGRREAGRS